MSRPTRAFLTSVWLKGLLGSLCLQNAIAADALTLDQALDLAETNHPQAHESARIAQQGAWADDDLVRRNFPQLTLGAQLTHQSDVVSFPGSLPAAFATQFQAPPKTQYKTTVQVEQVLFDGLAGHRSRAVAQARTAVEQAQNEVAIYTVRDQVISAYFGVLLARAKYDTSQLMLANLDSKLADVAVANSVGAAMQTDTDRLLAEKLMAIAAAESAQQDAVAALEMLSELTAEPLTAGTLLPVPQPATGPIESLPVGRPEWSLFSAQLTQVHDSQALTGSAYMPRLAAFANAGYGKPALNPLNPDGDWFYLVGLGLTWKPLDWGNARRQNKSLTLRETSIDAAKQTFARTIRLQLLKLNATIRSLQQNLENDEKLVALRGRIRDVASKQLSEGILVASDYIRELNAEAQAQLLYRIHLLQLALARQQYANLQGDATP